MTTKAPARQSAEPAKVDPTATVATIIKRYEPVIERLLAGTATSSATFTAWVANACRATPKLWQCEPETVLGAALRAAQLQMAPNDGNNLCWIIPYGRVATFQLGYGGVMELARRASPGLTFEGRPVYPGDMFDLVFRGTETEIKHRPAAARRPPKPRGGAAVLWYVIATYPDGRRLVHYLDREQVEYHRSFSKQADGDMWTKSYDAAALKSVVLDMRRWLPASRQIAVATEADGQVHDVRDMAVAGEIVHQQTDVESVELEAPEQLEPSPDNIADAEWIEQATNPEVESEVT
jgi:recombination protein RecT